VIPRVCIAIEIGERKACSFKRKLTARVDGVTGFGSSNAGKPDMKVYSHDMKENHNELIAIGSTWDINPCFNFKISTSRD
jgi:hypothetical protein